MRLEINQFGGMAPVIDPTALAETLAVFAKNVRLDRGVLAPGALKLMTSADYPDANLSGRGVRSVTKLLESDTRFAFSHPAGAQAFVSPVSPADTWGRVYFMSASGPSFTTTDQYSPGGLVINPTNYRLGVPGPKNPITIAGVTMEEVFEEGAPGDDGSVEQVFVEPDYLTVAYAYSFVDKYGHESALSPASEPVQIAYDRYFDVQLSAPESPPSRVNFAGGYRRIYRAAFDGSSSVWQYLADVSLGTTEGGDARPPGQEGEQAISQDWLPAPDDLKDLCLVASSYAAGFLDHYVCYSELKLPHAWPTELQYPVKYTPVSLMPMRNGLAIATSGRPYWAEGADPYSAIPQELPINAPCVSGDSLVDMGDYAMYVSYEGLVAIGPGRAEIVSYAVADRAVMEGLVDATCTAFTFDGRYVFSTSDDRWMGFIPERGLVEYDIGYPPSDFRAVSFSVRDNQHFFAFADGSVRVVDFDSEATDVEWHSKYWLTPHTSFSAFRVEADTYPVQVRVRCRYLNQAWQETPEYAVDDPRIQRLPVMTGGLWQVQVRPPAGGRVYRVVMGQSGEEAR